MSYVLTVISNAWFIVPAALAITMYLWTRAWAYILMAFTSGSYHMCNSFNLCLFEANIHRKLDFFYAQLLIPITALALISFSRNRAWIERWIILSFGFGLFIVEVLTDEPFEVQIVVAGISVLMLLIYWAVYAYKYQKFPPYRWDAFASGFAVTALACVLFATQKNWHAGYPYIHSVWHLLAAAGQYWLLKAGTKRQDPNAALDKLIPTHVERAPFSRIRRTVQGN